MITFPNESRSYDVTRQAIRFWGYYASMEASFFLELGALKMLQPDLKSNEPDLLTAFDRHRKSIYSAAQKVFARGRRGSYNIQAADL
jgi:hypothetical protein